MIIPRHYAKKIKYLLRQFPVVSVTGPRQVGKTTFVKMNFPSSEYLDLELPSDRQRLELLPEDTLKSLKSPAILDEIQSIPEVFPVLRALVDKKRKKNGQFILLGSASPQLIKGLSESLAGRIGFLELGGFSYSELTSSKNRISLKRLWQRGGFPDAVLLSSWRKWFNWMEGYTRTFIERDLWNLGVDIHPVRLRRLCGMISHAHGNIYNASEFGGSLGISYHTVNRYIDILENAFLLRVLRPWFSNLRKRLIRRPKIYWRDSGLLHYWLGLSKKDDILKHPKAGASWEGFIIEEIIKQERVFCILNLLSISFVQATGLNVIY